MAEAMAEATAVAPMPTSPDRRQPNTADILPLDPPDEAIHHIQKHKAWIEWHTMKVDFHKLQVKEWEKKKREGKKRKLGKPKRTMKK